jgi:GH35 family endo-1,4-beta-xylanase
LETSGFEQGYNLSYQISNAHYFGETKENNKTDYIVIANEVRIPSDWETPDIYWESFGIDYIVQAYKIARELYPKAILIFDDTDNHIRGTFGYETTILVSNKLFEEGLIDYVGLQMHMDPDKIPAKDEMINVFREYPVPVLITSFDVLLTNVPENEHDETLNDITRVVIEACLESQYCDHFITWGENDSVGWDGRSLLRDFDNNRKQAYYVGMQVMLEHIP